MRKTLLVGAGASVLVALAFLLANPWNLGDSEVGTRDTATRHSEQESQPRPEGAALPNQWPNSRQAQARLPGKASPASAASTAREEAKPRNLEADESGARVQVAAAIRRLRSLIEEPMTLEQHEELQTLLDSMTLEGKRNSVYLRGLIDGFQADPTSEAGKHLRFVLGQIRDPQVEPVALQLAGSGNPDKELAGFDLLAQLNRPSQEAFQLSSNVLARPNVDARVAEAALAALPVLDVSAEDRARIVSTLSSLETRHQDESVRSECIFKIGEFAKEASELSLLVDILKRPGPSDVRISAAMALQKSKVVGDSILSVLVDRMSDGDELWEIRRIAAESLSRFHLSGAARDAYDGFLLQQKLVAKGL